MLTVGFLGFGEQAAEQHASRLVEKWLTRVQIAAIGDVLASDVENVSGKLQRLHLDHVPVYLAPDELGFNPDDVHSVEDVLDQHPEIQAMIISTPPAKHFAQARACLERGVHVLVDKPLALTYEQAQQLIALTDDRDGPYLVVVSQRRYEKAYEYAKRVIDSGGIGKVIAVNSMLSHSMNWMGGWRLDPQLSGGGVLWDFGWHIIDTIIYLLRQKATTVTAAIHYLPELSVESYVSAHLLFERGIPVNVTINTGAPSNSVYEALEIWGSEGVLFLHRHRMRYSSRPPVVIHQLRDGTLVRRGHFGAAGKRWAPTEAFVKFLVSLPASGLVERRTSSGLLSQGKESLETVRVIEAMYASARYQMHHPMLIGANDKFESNGNGAAMLPSEGSAGA